VATSLVIEHASLTLKQLLEQHIIASTGTLATIDVILATSQVFADLKNANKATITLFLYRIVETPELRNSLQRRLVDGSLVRQPQVLELCYLVTPWGVRSGGDVTDASATQEEHRLLGLVMQCFYDHAEVGRGELFEQPTTPVWQPTDTMQLVMESLPVEDHYRIWDAGELSYRLSVTYRARVLGLDPSRVQRTVPVVDASFAVGHKR
jgi:hypothetical protein